MQTLIRTAIKHKLSIRIPSLLFHREDKFIETATTSHERMPLLRSDMKPEQVEDCVEQQASLQRDHRDLSDAADRVFGFGNWSEELYPPEWLEYEDNETDPSVTVRVFVKVRVWVTSPQYPCCRDEISTTTCTYTIPADDTRTRAEVRHWLQMVALETAVLRGKCGALRLFESILLDGPEEL
ncbi:hypothetical protein BO86DRAFT_405820 [Aspergillus japonicus CBS 114.51]|uniref:Uncharacterized protein n=1 Tax=Aspergillus japonicus CBS 114.51 TaxID=1448312 RepID=A0A8T8XGI8_ASPJA|nr:hypothetical protein BO86DRAFT_405820 [Aspergillus japonicus CBS 114.51]RAH86904.1 hypothetical protein BO86DRAFT_405820 [Aspergillus japonicus CBS 114.51]